MPVNTTHVISRVLRSMFVPTFGTETKLQASGVLSKLLAEVCSVSRPLLMPGTPQATPKGQCQSTALKVIENSQETKKKE
eukprot:bmy_10993T0